MAAIAVGKNSGMTTDRAIVLTGSEVSAVPHQPLGTAEGVTSCLLWTDGTSSSGVLTVEAGRRLGSHAHRTHVHHMWVLDGEAVVMGKRVGPRSYIHIPPGVDHDIDATDTTGCTMYYSYLLPG